MEAIGGRTDFGAEHQVVTNSFDDWRVVALALLMTVAGYSVIVGIPIMTSAWVAGLGFTEVQVGRLASVDIGGSAVGALFTVLIIAKVDRKLIAIAATIASVASNAFCLWTTDYEHTLILRSIAGIAGGVYLAVAVATLSANSKPERVFTLMLFMFVFTQAIQLALFTRFSIFEIYWALIALYVVGLPFMFWLPSRPETAAIVVEADVEDANHHQQHISAKLPLYIPIACLLAILATYINTSAYWTYISLAGEDAGVDPSLVSNGLVWGSLVGIISCVIAAVMSNRFGLSRPLIFFLALMMMSVGLLTFGVTDLTIMISLLTFNSLWILTDIYQMSAISRLDHSGRFPSLLIVSQGVGQAIGPNLGAWFLELGWGYQAIFTMCVVFCGVSMLIYIWIFFKVKAIQPELAKII